MVPINYCHDCQGRSRIDIAVQAGLRASDDSFPTQSLEASEVRLFGSRVHAVTLDQTCAIIYSWIDSTDQACRVVVTPNVDHIVKLQGNTAMRAAHDSASLVVADGWPVVAASRLLRSPLPERVAGSDLVPTLMTRWTRTHRLRVFLLGAAPGIADIAAARIVSRWPSVEICGTCSPPLGFERVERESDRIVQQVNDACPDLIIVGFGAPKQEIWLHHYGKRLRAKVAVAAGGTIDFLAGKQRRAPVWVRRIGMEWLHRLVSDPRRLIGRYAYDAWVFPQLVIKECLS
jgi:N-acetylglucosaminyldiphosphoundecaprenol N-acetyl-beta-D-mannosaminyltransferase